MISDRTIAILDHLFELIALKKRCQDTLTSYGAPSGPNHEIVAQLQFPPPELSGGKVTEKTLYRWMTQVAEVYEEEYLADLRLAVDHLSHPLPCVPPPPPIKTPNDDDTLWVVADDSPVHDLHNLDDEIEYNVPRFKWPEEEK